MSDQERFERVTSVKREVLQRLKKELHVEPMREDEFTVKEAAELLGVSEKTAMNRLKAMESEGEITSRLGQNPDGHQARLYRWAE